MVERFFNGDRGNLGDLDREVDESMRMFEQSQTGDVAVVEPRRPSRVLLVLDGSTQDPTSIAAAAWMRARFDTETLVLSVTEDSHESDVQTPDAFRSNQEIADQAAKQISGARVLARPESDRPVAAYDRILRHVADVDPDLTILPCPFGRDFESVGVDSAGTVVDVLLARMPKPMLIMRSARELEPCSRNVRLITGSECDVLRQSAAWALGLVSDGGELSFHVVIEKEAFENLRSVLVALSPDQEIDAQAYGDALAKSHGRLHRELAKTAMRRDVRYEMKAEAGEVAPPNPLDDDRNMLLVLPIEVDDRFHQGFVQDRIRRSPHPVLVVPGHVPTG